MARISPAEWRSPYGTSLKKLCERHIDRSFCGPERAFSLTLSLGFLRRFLMGCSPRGADAPHGILCAWVLSGGEQRAPRVLIALASLCAHHIDELFNIYVGPRHSRAGSPHFA